MASNLSAGTISVQHLRGGDDARRHTEPLATSVNDTLRNRRWPICLTRHRPKMPPPVVLTTWSTKAHRAHVAGIPAKSPVQIEDVPVIGFWELNGGQGRFEANATSKAVVNRRTRSTVRRDTCISLHASLRGDNPRAIDSGDAERIGAAHRAMDQEEQRGLMRPAPRVPLISPLVTLPRPWHDVSNP